MTSEESVKSQIFSSLKLKSTDELVEIWQKNNHIEWTNDAFDVVRELLLERLGALPEQSAPIQIVKTNESIAQELLKDYERKRGLSFLVDIFWAFCLFQAGVLIFALILWTGLTINNQTLDFKNMWFSILFACLAIPIYFLRKKILSLVRVAKQKVLGNIDKTLDHQ